jgi:hypothetical protein
MGVMGASRERGRGAWALLFITLTLACCTVSAFAQSHAERLWDTRSASPQANVLTLAAYDTVRVYAADQLAGEPDIPTGITVPTTYRPLLESMLRHSATFRRQCRRIALASHLRIVMRSTPLWPSTARARTRLLTTSEGLLAYVELTSMVDPVELIAHEFEHVVERLDGVDLRHQASLPRTGVRSCADGSYETLRAQRVGRQVALEVRAQAE